jgi:hypothetical protein
MREQQAPDLGRRLWCAEQVALHHRAAERAQQFLLLGGLDAFRRRRHVAFGGDVHHRLHDAGQACRPRDVGDEAAVDLVEGEALQVAQRGIAGAEITQRDAYPDVA